MRDVPKRHRVVQQQVLGKIDSDKLAVFVVWIPILKADDRDAARQSMAMVSDQRAIQFWDAKRNLGTRVAKEMVLPGNTKVAWDALPGVRRGRPVEG